MTFFDNSTELFPKNPSPTRTYHSYMCPSKCGYSNKNNGAENFIDKPTLVSPQTSITRDKRFKQNISKLRDILSDTIASLTRENNLKKGESVELTLEIELMKSMENTPTNSLVEVTIIQHNNKGESNNKLNKMPNKMLFKIERDKTLLSEPSIQKRQSWFKRVTSRENTASKPSKELRNKGGEQCEQVKNRKQFHKPLFCPTANQRCKVPNNPELHDTRKKFINILPEETNYNEDVSKGYHKIPKRENKQDQIGDTCTMHGMPKKINKKNSLIKKISDVFLPPKKPSKNKVVETALTALKNEIDSMKTVVDEKDRNKNIKKRDKTPVHNLGKLVNNILFDVMASMDGEDKNKVKEELKLPLQYHSFFEPVTKTNKKHKKLTKRKTSPSIKRLYRSHSDTCCVRKLKSEIEARVKSSNSIGDCRSQMGTKTPPLVVCMGDKAKQAHKKRRKRSNTRDYSKGRKKNLKSDKIVLPNTSAEDDIPKHNIPQKSALFSRNSLIQWNGRYVKVSKDMKARIEMLIVNELENLALKEGMECDVTPLPSSEDSSKDSNTVEKMSSFICELDISDKNVRKMMKTKKSLHRKVSVHQSPIEERPYNLGHKGRTRTTITSSGTQTVPISGIQTQPRKNSDNVNDSPINENDNPHQVTNNYKNPVPVYTSDVKQDSVEIKYMNKNVHNWSAESQTITFYSPEMITSNQQNTIHECIGQSSKGKKNSRFISTGFVKIIQSDDSTWNNCFPQSDIVRCDRQMPTQDPPETNLNTTGQSSSAAGKSSSKISNELDSSIEIELDIQDLEYILKQAKQNYNADKVLIEAKCVHPLKTIKPIKPIGKNSPSYTNQLLTNAAKKLEKYANTKTRNKKSKY